MGILQVLTDANGTWRYIDASTWALKDAIVACTDLGEHDYIYTIEQDRAHAGNMQAFSHRMWA